MNFEKLLELILNNPTNLNIKYSNINGEEKLTVNGEDVTIEESFDDSEIKNKVDLFKSKLETLDDRTFELIMDEVERRHLNLTEMNKSLDLEHYDEEKATYVNNVITILSEIVRNVIKEEIENLNDILKEW